MVTKSQHCKRMRPKQSKSGLKAEDETPKLARNVVRDDKTLCMFGGKYMGFLGKDDLASENTLEAMLLKRSL
eukprot:364675-Chlamydomonas_euryale.AAC.3